MILNPIFHSSNQGGSITPLATSLDFLPVCVSKSPQVLFSVYCNDMTIKGFTQLVLGAKGLSQYTQGTWEISLW